MKLYLQFGHGMIAHTKELLATWRSGGVVMSPRDSTAEQLVRVAKSALEVDAEPLLDPQCYVRDADKEKLTAHSYWKAIKENATGAFTGGPGTDALLSELAILAKSAGIRRHILPGCLAKPVSDDWFALQEAVMAAAPRHFGEDAVLMTIALSADAMMDEAQVEAVVDRAARWPVSGFYVVCEAPSTYLVENPVWLANVLILTSGLKLLNRSVIVGYSNHQLLGLGAANVDAMASGTWLNVRAFDPDKFFEPDEDEVSRRALWYYCPQALSEYKLPFLDIAQKVGVLDSMRSTTPYAAPLFAGAVPSTVAWGEQDAFRHYLTALREQVTSARVATFEGTVAVQDQLIARAEKLLGRLAKNGVRGQDRDFANYIDVDRAATVVFQRARGARLKRTW
jgi:hypothetical protein